MKVSRSARKAMQKCGGWMPPPHSSGPREFALEQRFVPRWVTNTHSFKEHEYGERQLRYVITNAHLAEMKAKEAKRARREPSSATLGFQEFLAIAKLRLGIPATA